MKLTKQDNELVKLISRGYITKSNLLKILNISLPVINKLIENNQLKAIKVGNQTRIYKEEVVRFLKEGNLEN